MVLDLGDSTRGCWKTQAVLDLKEGQIRRGAVRLEWRSNRAWILPGYLRSSLRPLVPLELLGAARAGRSIAPDARHPSPSVDDDLLTSSIRPSCYSRNLVG